MILISHETERQSRVTRSYFAFRLKTTRFRTTGRTTTRPLKRRRKARRDTSRRGKRTWWTTSRPARESAEKCATSQRRPKENEQATGHHHRRACGRLVFTSTPVRRLSLLIFYRCVSHVYEWLARRSTDNRERH